MYLYDRLENIDRIRYPFKEGCNLVYGAVTVPDDLFRDVSISAYYARQGLDRDCYLASFTRVATSAIQFRFNVLGFEFDVLVDSSGDGLVTMLVLDNLKLEIELNPASLLPFTNQLLLSQEYVRLGAATGIIEPTCLLASEIGAVDYMIGDYNSTAIYGDINVVNGINTEVYISEENNTVYIIAKPGIGDTNCEEQITGTDDEVLKSFNGLKAGESGDVTLRTNGRILLVPSEDGLELELRVAEDVASLLDCSPDYST